MNMELEKFTWEELMNASIHKLMQRAGSLDVSHTVNTPSRVVGAYQEYFSGLDQDPAQVLSTGFERGAYDQMIVVNNIAFTSFCAHHLIPFLGVVHFAYMPGNKIVGLSKIPRFVDILARRPQVQENFTQELVEVFQKTVAPRGCAAFVEAAHLCVFIRGVKKSGAITRTSALKGMFLDASVKQEFMSIVARSSKGLLGAFE
jgi:GTP cyclohydrolase I